MSIKAYKLYEQGFTDAMLELKKAKLPVKAAYRILTMAKALDAEREKLNEMRDAIIKTHAETNEDGTLKLNEQGNIVLKMAELQQYTTQINEFNNMDIDVGEGIKTEEVVDFLDKLSVEDLIWLEGVLV